MDGLFGYRKRSNSKTLSCVDLFKKLLSSCRQDGLNGVFRKRIRPSVDSLHNTAYAPFFRITREHFVYLFSIIECRISLSSIEFYYRMLNLECHNVFVWTGIFSKTFIALVDADLFIRMCFQNIRIYMDRALSTVYTRLYPNCSGYALNLHWTRPIRTHLDLLSVPARDHCRKDPVWIRSQKGLVQTGGIGFKLVRIGSDAEKLNWKAFVDISKRGIRDETKSLLN